MSTIAKLEVEIGANSTKLTKGLGNATNDLISFGKGLDNAGKQMTKWVTGSMLGVGAGLGMLVKQALDVERGMSEVFTLMPGMTRDAMDVMTKDVMSFSKEFGTLPDKVIPALYQSISASVPPDNVFDFLAVAQKAAIGGVTELETAVDGITSVVNAYGSEVISAAQASDLMFTAVKLGKTDFSQLSRSLFNVIPTASALGVGFEDVAAGLAAITSQGTPTSVATTQMRQMFVELSKEGSKTSKVFQGLSGKTFKDFIREGGNTQDALVLLEKHAQRSNIGVNDLFSSVEAGNAALALTGQGTAKFSESLKEMESAAGATETAYETMEQGVSRQLERIINEFKILGIEIGHDFLPIVEKDLLPILRDDVMPILKDFAALIGDLAKRFSELDPETRRNIIQLMGLTFVAGPALSILGKLLGVVGSLKGLFLGSAAGAAGLKGGLLGLLAPFALVGAAVYGTYLLISDFEGTMSRIRDNFIKLGESMIGAFKPIRDFYDWYQKISPNFKFDFTVPSQALFGKTPTAAPTPAASQYSVGSQPHQVPASVRNSSAYPQPTPSTPGVRGSLTPMAEGAFVTKPTMALIGEGSEPEGVFPLSRLERLMEQKHGSGGQRLEVHHSGTVRHEGINDEGQLEASVDVVMDRFRWEGRL